MSKSILIKLIKEELRHIFIEQSAYPAGAINDSNAPWNQPESDYDKPIEPDIKVFQSVYYTPQGIAILKDKQNNKYVFYHEAVEKDELMPYAYVEKKYVGKDIDGLPEYEYSDDWKIDKDVIERYVNDNLNILKFKKGISGWEEGADMIKIDRELMRELVNIYGASIGLRKALMSENYYDYVGKEREYLDKKKYEQDRIKAVKGVVGSLKQIERTNKYPIPENVLQGMANKLEQYDIEPVDIYAAIKQPQKQKQYLITGPSAPGGGGSGALNDLTNILRIHLKEDGLSDKGGPTGLNFSERGYDTYLKEGKKKKTKKKSSKYPHYTLAAPSGKFVFGPKPEFYLDITDLYQVGASSKMKYEERIIRSWVKKILFESLSEAIPDIHFEDRVIGRLESELYTTPLFLKEELAKVEEQVKLIEKINFNTDESWAIFLKRYPVKYVSKDPDAPNDPLKISNGSDLWIIVRSNEIRTIMFRRDNQYLNPITDIQYKIKFTTLNEYYDKVAKTPNDVVEFSSDNLSLKKKIQGGKRKNLKFPIIVVDGDEWYVNLEEEELIFKKNWKRVIGFDDIFEEFPEHQWQHIINFIDSLK